MLVWQIKQPKLLPPPVPHRLPTSLCQYNSYGGQVRCLRFSVWSGFDVCCVRFVQVTEPCSTLGEVLEVKQLLRNIICVWWACVVLNILWVSEVVWSSYSLRAESSVCSYFVLQVYNFWVCTDRSKDTEVVCKRLVTVIVIVMVHLFVMKLHDRIPQQMDAGSTLFRHRALHLWFYSIWRYNVVVVTETLLRYGNCLLTSCV